MNSAQLKAFFEENEFDVHLTKQCNVQCAEVEKWTNGGVDMVIWLNPFTVKEFKSYVDDFDVDDTIDMHRQAQDYKTAFTISQSLEDFTDFKNHLLEIKAKLL